MLSILRKNLKKVKEYIKNKKKFNIRKYRHQEKFLVIRDCEILASILNVLPLIFGFNLKRFASNFGFNLKRFASNFWLQS